MTAAAVKPVNYQEAARRHFEDASLLLCNTRYSNAGQLFGISVECGIKAILVCSGVPVDESGSIDRPANVKGKAFREHMPDLTTAVQNLAHVIPDNRKATTYLSAMPNQTLLSDWSMEHRYWTDSALPSASQIWWQKAASEVLAALDQAVANGDL